jgi:hypothetical protein
MIISLDSNTWVVYSLGMISTNPVCPKAETLFPMQARSGQAIKLQPGRHVKTLTTPSQLMNLSGDPLQLAAMDLVTRELLNHPKDETITAAIKDLCTKISGEFNTHELFKQIATLKDLLASGHWLFTSPGTMIVITILVVLVTFSTWKTCCVSQTQALSTAVSSTVNKSLSSPPPLLVFNRTIATVTVTLN